MTIELFNLIFVLQIFEINYEKIKHELKFLDSVYLLKYMISQ